MAKAPALKKGDLIGVFAPSSYVDKRKVQDAQRFLEGKGFRVYVHPQTFNRHNQSAGTHDEKLAAYYDLLRDKNVKAIFAAGGGNRALHLLDKIDYALVKKHPKILMGFSDVTALLNAVRSQTGLITFHGPVLTWLPKLSALYDFNLKVLSGKTPSYPMKQCRVLREGTAEGPLLGGNLSLFHLLPHTAQSPKTKGAILFLEDVAEDYSKIDRMFAHLKRTGVLDDISGIICGGFTELTDTGRPYGFTLDDIVMEHVGDRKIPVIMDAPFGHTDQLYILPVGGKAALSAKRGKATLKLTEPAVKP